jgi:hypothetical protein
MAAKKCRMSKQLTVIANGLNSCREREFSLAIPGR